MAGTDDRAEGPRRHYLAALAYEAEVRGLRCRLMGPDDSLLRVSSPVSGQSTIVLVMPSSPVTWSYLWSGDGFASAADPSHAAELLAASLGR